MARIARPAVEQSSVLRKRVEKFVSRYVDSPAKAELLRVLCYRPTHFHSLPEILALSKSSAVEIERAAFSLRGLGFVQFKSSPQGAVMALAPDSPVRKLAPALWSYLKNLHADSGAISHARTD